MQGPPEMAAFALSGAMTVGYYIDGFNLYYRALRGTVWKWLDPTALCQRLSPNATIGVVHCFTARIQSRPSDPDQAQRQQAYLRALATRPLVQVHLGRFLTTTVRMPLANPGPTGPATVRVLKTATRCLPCRVRCFRGDLERRSIVPQGRGLSNRTSGGGRSGRRYRGSGRRSS